ncbi:spore cortex-lytic enzyme [Ferroacidibacillus organovorans]|uniref:Spore cortex-lytic enzyme n=2 Tax=Ferroacidibacillus organovorans TaxID=1765683 RepID=A0A853KCV2_9BACL|nr:spore cortex-lytic enzyme [Ferroacidibacillus organovorans]KYP80478.1 hypothetical protein AYJ22_02190 [Ferroacidibacillus organovorans]OAG94707.1 hypothetical protein AYW79_03960 [Ferroacidibacillus organovorans]
MRRSWLAVVSLTVFTMVAGILPSAHTHAETWALMPGERGTSVVEVQANLKRLGYYNGPIDGIYTWQTYWAVRDFQNKFGLPIDGLAGAQTLNMLHSALRANFGTTSTQIQGGTPSPTPMTSPPPTHIVPTNTVAQTAPAPSSTAALTPPSAGTNVTIPSSGVNGISANDIQMMSQVVYGEARGQPFIGQVAVAAVMMNRLHSSLFPHSIPAILYQPGAFTAVSNGQASLGTDPEATAAVLDAIHGYDPTHGALYYWNPATATSPWVWSQPIMLRIGNHVFAK